LRWSSSPSTREMHVCAHWRRVGATQSSNRRDTTSRSHKRTATATHFTTLRGAEYHEVLGNSEVRPMSMICRCPHCNRGYETSECKSQMIPNGSVRPCPRCGELILHYEEIRCPGCGTKYRGPVRLVEEIPKYLYSYECKHCGEAQIKDLTPRFMMYERVGWSYLVRDPVYDT